MKSIKFKKRARGAISLLLILAVCIAGAFAFLTAQDSKLNVFTIGNVNIELAEDFDTNLNDVIESDGSERYSTTEPPVVNDVIPGQQILKQPFVTNTGANKAWTFVAVGLPTAEAKDIYVDENGDLAVSGQELKVTVRAFAIQEDYKDATTAKDTWDAYLNSDDTKTNLFGEEVVDETVLNNRIQLFNLVNENGEGGLDEDAINNGWTKLNDTAYASNDGHNYIFYAYNEVLEPEAVTSKLFSAVEVSELIGDVLPDEYFLGDFEIID